ncbi:uncharacterized protein DUF262 [Leucobacter luti]|uniref:Uncharacterized protein DUF262 n=1 Tax=Leucobacter luti TaxID=340320 RepID=A0A4R6RTE9_9MICO|nr:DUF262 domain-containing protein [Leucobacter luti]TDP89597.1 uncharacterized protein DUF262 [Leucobacter luti]
MTRQTAHPITHQTLTASNRSAREVARLLAAGDLSPAYQRGSVWTDDQRIGLIRSWLIGMPIPAVIINDRLAPPWPKAVDGFPLGNHLYGVIDGKQRIETAIAWFDGLLPVPASWFPAEQVADTTVTDDGLYVTYQQLTPTGQRLFTNRALLPVIETAVGTIAEEADLYLLVNAAGTQQTEADLANAKLISE